MKMFALKLAKILHMVKTSPNGIYYYYFPEVK